jgi:hypothetical protein
VIEVRDLSCKSSIEILCDVAKFKNKRKSVKISAIFSTKKEDVEQEIETEFWIDFHVPQAWDAEAVCFHRSIPLKFIKIKPSWNFNEKSNTIKFCKDPTNLSEFYALV